MDTHDPYLPPPPYDRRFPGKNASFSWEADYWPLAEDILSGKREIAPTEQAHLISQYDGALAYLYDQLGVLCDRLRQDGWYDRSLLIVTSDHGEAFGEKSILRHGVSLYQSQINIPLIIKYPNQTSFVEIQSPVNLVDLAPTVLRSLGMELPEILDGSSLFDSEPPRGRFLVAESYIDARKVGLNRRYVGIDRAILSGRFKYMTFRTAPAELYDLVTDPSELDNLAGRDGPVSAELNRELGDWLQRVQPPAAPMLMEKENRERFEALGY
jgi:arylsulfatase A-like enzyme